MLCVGYALYAVGNTVLMILLYFTDYFGAVCCAAIFAGSATVLTVISQFVPVTLMGFGFLLGASAFLLAAVVRLAVFTDNLPYRARRAADCSDRKARMVYETGRSVGRIRRTAAWNFRTEGIMRKRGKHGKERTNDDG